MNISEDKFANKSADQIVKDVLEQHKQNAKDALAYIQNISSDDGLSLSNETKAQLKKAEDMLVNRVKRESMIEGVWPFKKKEPEPQKYEARMICCPPFKKEPLEVMLPPITSVDDPIVDQYVQLIRKKHPHSPIMLRSEAGWKTFYENTNHDYTVKAYNKEGKIVESKAGNLPIAMGLSEKLYESNNYDKIEVLKENKTISTYKGLTEGWLVEDNKQKTQPDNADFNYEYYKDTKNPNKVKAKKIKYKVDDKDADLTSKLIGDFANTDLIQTASQAGLGALTGMYPGFFGGITHNLTNHLLNKHNIKTAHKKKIADLNNRYGITEDESNSITTDDILKRDYLDLEKSIGSINRRLLYSLAGINPSLDDTRKPKFKWPDGKKFPKLSKRSVVPENYVVLDGIIPTDNKIPQGNELVDEIKQAYGDEEKFNILKDKYLGNSPKVVLVPKVPVKDLGPGKKGQRLYQWVEDKENPIFVSINGFKNLLNSIDNAETMSKFNKKHSEDLNNLIARDVLAYDDIDNNFTNWENEHSEEYELDRFDTPTKGNIYRDWKKNQTIVDHNYSDEEFRKFIDDKYYYPQFKETLDLEDPMINHLFNQVTNLIDILGKKPNKQKELEDILNNEFLDNLEETDNPTELFKSVWNNMLADYFTENLINQITNDKLNTIEDFIKANEDKNPELAKNFASDKEALLKSYTIPYKKTNIKAPAMLNKQVIEKQVNDLFVKYTKELKDPENNKSSKNSKDQQQDTVPEGWSTIELDTELYIPTELRFNNQEEANTSLNTKKPNIKFAVKNSEKVVKKKGADGKYYKSVTATWNVYQTNENGIPQEIPSKVKNRLDMHRSQDYDSEYQNTAAYNKFLRDKYAKANDDTAETEKEVLNIITKYTTGDKELDKANPVLNLLYSINGLYKIDSNKPDPKKLKNRTKYSKKALDLIKELEKNYKSKSSKSRMDITNPEVINQLNSLLRAIKDETTNWTYSMDKALQHQSDKQLAAMLNGPDIEDEE